MPSDGQISTLHAWTFTHTTQSIASRFRLQHVLCPLTQIPFFNPLQIILELSATGDATYLTQHHQLYIDEYFYINCTNTVPRPSPTPLFLLD